MGVFKTSEIKNENITKSSKIKYNEIIKAKRNAEYLAMLDKSIAELESGQGQEHELIEVDDE